MSQVQSAFLSRWPLYLARERYGQLVPAGTPDMLTSPILLLSLVFSLLVDHIYAVQQHTVDSFGEYSEIDENEHEDVNEDFDSSSLLSNEHQVIFFNNYAFPVDVLWKDPAFPNDKVTLWYGMIS